MLLTACVNNPASQIPDSSPVDIALSDSSDVEQPPVEDLPAEEKFSRLGLEMGMDSTVAEEQLAGLRLDETLGEIASVSTREGTKILGYDYHLQGPEIDAKAVWEDDQKTQTIQKKE